MKRLLAMAVGALAMAIGSLAQAASINVLWYGQSNAYNTAIAGLAANAHTYDPASDGSLTWNLTFWNAGDPTPAFGSYDVLVIGSSQAFGMGFNATRLLGAKSAIEAARGTRTFLSGQDADWHYLNSPGPMDNGPRGFLINAVNWAASGSGLGIVALADGWQGTGSQWWLNTNSFLAAELAGVMAYFQEESVVIPPATASFPVNEGLTTGGLSNWGVSSHSGFTSTPTGYLPINDSGSYPGWRVTIVTEQFASGCTTGCGDDPVPVPAPPALLLFGTALAGLVLVRRRRPA